MSTLENRARIRWRCHEGAVVGVIGASKAHWEEVPRYTAVESLGINIVESTEDMLFLPQAPDCVVLNMTANDWICDLRPVEEARAARRFRYFYKLEAQAGGPHLTTRDKIVEDISEIAVSLLESHARADRNGKAAFRTSNCNWIVEYQKGQ